MGEIVELITGLQIHSVHRLHNWIAYICLCKIMPGIRAS